MPNRRVVLSFVAMASGACLLMGSPAARAQTPAPPDDFASLLGALSARYHIAFVAEAEPLHPTAPPEKMANVRQAFESGTSPEKAVEEVADAFDYEAERAAGDLFLLRKRYSDPADLPFLTFDEVHYDLATLLRSLAPLLPATPDIRGPGTLNPGPYLVKRFAETLSPEQVAAMPQGIPISPQRPDPVPGISPVTFMPEVAWRPSMMFWIRWTGRAARRRSFTGWMSTEYSRSASLPSRRSTQQAA
jgi:hypothetical protein